MKQVRMKIFGIVLLVVGSLWALVAFNTDTTVRTESQFIGSTYIPSQKVHNIGKMDERRNHLMLSALVIVVGVILFAVGKSKQLPSESPIGEVKIEGSKNRQYRDERNIQIGKYQLFLTEKYSIQKNATLEKYVVDDNLFETLEDALRYADGKETQEIQESFERLKDAFMISIVTQNSNASFSGIKVNDILLTYNETSITNDQDIADAISSVSKPDASLVVLRERERITIKVRSGSLGIFGSVVALDSNAYEARVKSLQAPSSIL